MKVEFRNLMKPTSDFQSRYCGILPYVIFVNERSRKEMSHWLYIGFLGWCLAIELVTVKPDEYRRTIWKLRNQGGSDE